MSAVSATDASRVIVITPAMVQQVGGDIRHIQQAVLNHLLSISGSPESKQRARQYVAQTFPLELMLIPPEKMLPRHVTDYFREVRSKWALPDSLPLYQLWMIDTFQRFEMLEDKCSRREVSVLKNEFAGVALSCKTILGQKKIRTVLTGFIPSILLYAEQRLGLPFNLPKLVEIRKAVGKICDGVHQGEVKKDCERLLRALEIGLEMWRSPYQRNYMERCPLRAFVPKTEDPDVLQGAKQLDTFLRMTRAAWTKVHDMQWLSTVAEVMLKLRSPPTGLDLNAQSARAYRLYIQQVLLALYSYDQRIILLNFRALQGTVTWEECSAVLGSPLDPNSGVDIKLWLSDSAACFHGMVEGLSDFLKMFETQICKRCLPDFFTFEELFQRLIRNFVKVFGEHEPCSVLPAAVEDFEQEDLRPLIRGFARDITQIVEAFKRQLETRLPPLQHSREIVKLLGVVGPNLCFSALFAEILYPYRAAVIFAATKALPALEKAKMALLARFEKALKRIDPASLRSHQEALAIVLRSRVLFQLRAYAELFIVLRDIQVVLLAPVEHQEAWERGLHLLPLELTRFLQLPELDSLIEAHLQQQEATSEPVEEAPIEVPEVEDEKEPQNEIPPLPLEEESKSNTVLETLQEFESFKISQGTKTRVLLDRLRKLGVYIKRQRGSHQILGHLNTRTTFSLPRHEDVSDGVARNLEKWVCTEIFKTG